MHNDSIIFRRKEQGQVFGPYTPDTPFLFHITPHILVTSDTGKDITEPFLFWLTQNADRFLTESGCIPKPKPACESCGRILDVGGDPLSLAVNKEDCFACANPEDIWVKRILALEKTK